MPPFKSKNTTPIRIDHNPIREKIVMRATKESDHPDEEIKWRQFGSNPITFVATQTGLQWIRDYLHDVEQYNRSQNNQHHGNIADQIRKEIITQTPLISAFTEDNRQRDEENVEKQFVDV